jgi:hypothetical protein
MYQVPLMLAEFITVLLNPCPVPDVKANEAILHREVSVSQVYGNRDPYRLIESLIVVISRYL